MAEENSNFSNTRSGFFGGAMNVPKWFMNNFVFDSMRYFRTGKSELIVTRSPFIRGMIDTLASRITDLKQLESQYDVQIEKTLKPHVHNMYKKLGPYTSVDVCEKELQYVVQGTGMEDREINILGQTFSYPFPKPKELVFPDGARQVMQCYGRDESLNMSTRISNFLGEVRQHALAQLETMNITDDQKTLRRNQIQTFMTSATNKLTDLLGRDEGEGAIYNIYNNQKQVLEDYRSLIQNSGREGWKLVNENRPIHVVYKHTYWQIRPEKVDANGNCILFENGVANWDLREGEVAPGLDDRGWPLEVVGPDGYTFVDKNHNEHVCQPGDVLLDIFQRYDTDPPQGTNPANVQIRNVPIEWIKQMDLKDVSRYVHVEWDEYRDDLRDGRYHPESLTINDYTLAASTGIGGEWHRVRLPQKLHTYSERQIARLKQYRMRLYGANAPFNQTITASRKPQDLNPACDLRCLEFDAKGKVLNERYQWRYIGKRRYYATSNEIDASEQKEFMLSTRGLSMLIIEEVCRQGKTLKEIHEDLVEIGKKVGGYDYGPKPFGDLNLTMDPFRVQYERVNEARRQNRAEMEVNG